MKKIYVYALLGRVRNKVFYVGATANIETRKSAHKSKYGKRVYFLVLDEYSISEYKAFAVEPETYWIHQMITWGFNLDNIRQTPANIIRRKSREVIPSNFIEYLQSIKKAS